MGTTARLSYPGKAIIEFDGRGGELGGNSQRQPTVKATCSSIDANSSFTCESIVAAGFCCFMPLTVVLKAPPGAGKDDGGSASVCLGDWRQCGGEVDAGQVGVIQPRTGWPLAVSPSSRPVHSATGRAHVRVSRPAGPQGIRCDAYFNDDDRDVPAANAIRSAARARFLRDSSMNFTNVVWNSTCRFALTSVYGRKTS